MIKLIPMTQNEYDAFLERSVPEYAAENVRAGYWDESEALERSKKEFDELLPNGLGSENHHLFTITTDEGPAGVIWMRANVNQPIKAGFIFELYVDEKFRGRGYAQQAMLLLEEKARELGLVKIALHVFASNDTARRLYERLGYQVNSMNMSKPLNE
jgi:ribosomal protein S18 acetylase RimI-like enzyme